MMEKDWVSWNAMIVGYAQNGYGNKALELCKKMLASGEKPDHVTMIGILCACSHAGLVEEGRHYFSSMGREYGEYVAKKLLEIDPGNSGHYVLFSNMYAELGRWGDVCRIRKVTRKQGVIKQPGCSWIEIKRHVSVFMVKDKRHPQRKDIYLALNTLIKHMKRAGYIPDAGDQEKCESELALSYKNNFPATAAFG
ncbi:hypothetical protein PTKIN_Ptkin02bG0102100 [Pterospermum kingtungense]